MESSEREELRRLVSVISDYDVSDELKLFLNAEYVLVCLDIYEYNPEENLDLWQELRKALANHPLKHVPEARQKLHRPELAKKGYWWRDFGYWELPK